MSQSRIQMNATILPNGKVLAVGGSRNDEDAATASLNADLYDPATNTFSSAGANAFPRLYHSDSLLLPDATVLLVGEATRQRGNYERRLEIYSPAYLFNGDGNRCRSSHHRWRAPATVGYGAAFQVQTPGCRGNCVGGARAAGRPHACVRHGAAARRLVVHGGERCPERHGAAKRQHRAARVLHAVRVEQRGNAVGGPLRASARVRSEPDADCDDHQPGRRT